jgi:hypothetical protein
MNKITFSVFTKSNGTLTKDISPDGLDGAVSTVQTMVFEAFGPYIRSLGKNHAITHGIHQKSKGTKEEVCK